MTNRKRFFLNGALLTIVGVAIRSVSIAFNSFVTRCIGAEGVGLFTLIGTVYAFAVTFATSGISLTVTRLVSSAVGEEKRDAVRGILRSSVFYALIFSSFATAMLLIFSSYIGTVILSDARTILPLRALALSLLPLSLSSVFSGYFVGVKRVSKNAAVQVLGQAFKIIITVCIVLKLSPMDAERGVLVLSIVAFLSELVVFIFALVQFVFDKNRNFREEKKGARHMRSVCEMALPLAFSAYVRSALLTVEHVLIPKRLRDSGNSHSDALTSYGVLHGMALPMLLYPMVTLSSFSGLLVPEFAESMARGERARMSKVASEAINKTLVYAVVSTVFLFLFSEEIGYVVYDSYDAGCYIAIMSFVIPIMYLDHVTDSILKGIGEHVYSMWVNISDSFLSIVLVWFLIPKLGIAGYAVVIVVMEGYNFLLSATRLYTKIKFRISFFSSILLPFVSAFLSAHLTKRLFKISGESTTAVWLFLRLLFALSLFLSLYLLSRLIQSNRKTSSKSKRNNYAEDDMRVA